MGIWTSCGYCSSTGRTCTSGRQGSDRIPAGYIIWTPRNCKTLVRAWCRRRRDELTSERLQYSLSLFAIFGIPELSFTFSDFILPFIYNEDDYVFIDATLKCSTSTTGKTMICICPPQNRKAHDNVDVTFIFFQVYHYQFTKSINVYNNRIASEHMMPQRPRTYKTAAKILDL